MDFPKRESSEPTDVSIPKKRVRRTKKDSERREEKKPTAEERLSEMKLQAERVVQAYVAAQELSLEELLTRLSNTETKLAYEEQKAIVGHVLEIADARRFAGDSVDDRVKPVLDKLYKAFSYSEVYQTELIRPLTEQDPESIGSLLADQKFTMTTDLERLLKTDEQRVRAFEMCKENLSVAALLILKVSDTDLALRLLGQLPRLREIPETKRPLAIGQTIESIASRLKTEGKIDALINAVQTGLIDLTEIKPVINQLQEEPERLIDLAKAARSVNGFTYALKFLADPKQIQSIVDQGSAAVPHLSPEHAEEALGFAKKVQEALSKEPNLFDMSSLVPDEPNNFFKEEKDPKNKFVVGIDRQNSYCIAWGDIKTFNYHADLFRSIPSVEKCGGGYISVQETPEGIQLQLKRDSSDFGFYSKAVLDRFQSPLLKALQDSFPGKKISLTIDRSGGY